MAAAGVYEELTDMTSCQICFESFDGQTPKMLDCLHFFCQKCLQRILDNAEIANTMNQNRLRCPVCQQTTVIPGGRTADLRPYFHISKFQDMKKTLEESHRICCMCKSDTHKSEISYHCFVCCYGHCKDCHAGHKKVYPNHSQIPVTPNMVDYIMCREHYVQFEHFCSSCLKPICSQCRIGGHCDHKVFDLVYDGKNVLAELRETLCSALNTVYKTLEELEELESNASHSIDKAMKEMKQHRDYLLSQIEEQYDSLCEEFNQVKEDISETLSASKLMVENDSLYIENLLSEIDKLDKPVKEVPLARIDFAQFKVDVEHGRPSTCADIRPPTVSFVKTHDAITLGKIVKQEFKSPAIVGSSSVEERAVSSLPILDAELLTDSMKPVLVNQIETESNDMEFLDSGELTVCTSNCLIVYDDSGRKMDNYLSKICGSTRGILTSISMGGKIQKLAMTENKGWRTSQLHIFTPSLGSWQYKAVDTCREPQFVAVTSDGGYVVFSNDEGEGGKKLHVYNGSFNLISSINMADDVLDVFVDDNDQLFVCVMHNVHVLKKDGQKVASLATNHLRMEPHGVHVNKSGQIFVSDRKRKGVLLFDANYQFVRRLIDFDFTPNRLSLWKNRKLCVSGPRKIYVYSF